MFIEDLNIQEILNNQGFKVVENTIMEILVLQLLKLSQNMKI